MHAISRVHRRLYQTDEVILVECKQYLEELCAEMAESMLPERPNVRIVVKAEPCRLPSERCTNLGLILNELVTNSLKHAFPAGAPGCITVHFGARKDRYELKVADDGRGLPAGFDSAAGTGLGSKLIRSFAEQLSGKLRCGSGPGGRGTEVCIRFR